MTDAPRSVHSQCPYCGVGCGLELMPPAVKGQAVRRDEEGNPMWTARGDRSHPSSLGQVCIKGATVGETLARGRLREPLFRTTLEEPFQPISWDAALERITSQIQASVARRGHADGIAMYGSGQFHTEDYYLAQKLLKGALGTTLHERTRSVGASPVQSFGDVVDLARRHSTERPLWSEVSSYSEKYRELYPLTSFQIGYGRMICTK